MGAQMNIKSDEAYALASELAGIEKVSMTQAVLKALRARKREFSKEAKVQKIMEFARETAAMMSPELRALDVNEYLYDEYGLPK